MVSVPQPETPTFSTQMQGGQFVVVPTPESPALCFTHSPYGALVSSDVFVTGPAPLTLPNFDDSEARVRILTSPSRPVAKSPPKSPPALEDTKQKGKRQRKNKKAFATLLAEMSPRTGASSAARPDPSNPDSWSVVADSAGGNATPDTPPSPSQYLPSFVLPSVRCVVEFKRGRTETYSAINYVAPGEYVIVEGDRGEDMGLVIHTWISATPMRPTTSPDNSDDETSSKDEESDSLPSIRRLATPADISKLHNVVAKDEEAAVMGCGQRVRERHLDMQIVDAEYQFDGQKLTFFYDTPTRQDFRDLCKDLFRTYRTRIWFSRVGSTADTPTRRTRFGSHHDFGKRPSRMHQANPSIPLSPSL
eukprot:NODE_567_length_1803_cov_68.831146_g558_i0.p1 GENE.NODE_567_length_1803_cov_68.831146_g558_i0~~NODE_567_length_1803_cov_68.831146_g558_i0.p1  ORF type:complete len:362 (-),score=46.17 NODE_567_length_1803_cov_68.831146_g558_i0:581-1666(-)